MNGTALGSTLRKIVTGSCGAARAGCHDGARSALRFLDEACEYWMGFDLPPAERHLRESGWLPDDASAYCARCGDSVGPGEADGEGCASCRSMPPVADRVVRLGGYCDPLREWVLQIKYRRRWEEMAEVLGARLGEAVARTGGIDTARTIVVPMPMPWSRRVHRGIDHARALASGAARALGAPCQEPLFRRHGRPQALLPASERARAGGRGMALRRRWSGVAARDVDSRRANRCESGRGARSRTPSVPAASSRIKAIARAASDAAAHPVARSTAEGTTESAARSAITPWSGAHIVLIDDVRTTGATLRAASRRLRRLRPARLVAAVVAVADDPARRRDRAGDGGGLGSVPGTPMLGDGAADARRGDVITR